jgi:hypothetical protein
MTLWHPEKLETLAYRLSGPYRNYIAALSRSNPSLNKPDPNNEDIPLKSRKGVKVVLLDAPSTGQPSFQQTCFEDAPSLEEHFETSPNHGRRRIYLMENLSSSFIAVMGGHFFMNPTFFQRQERTCVWSNKFTPTSDMLPQPSLLDPDHSFHLQYCELRQFNQEIPNQPYFCSSTRRHIGMTQARQKEDSTIGIMRRKVSWWSREADGGGWDGIPHPFVTVGLILMCL